MEIRNFCIIAHIDHGKSTLADRLLETTGTVEKRRMKEQLLDQMDIEQERGITIKLQPVRMEHNGVQLNLIDTPGHVDFTYEVSRSLQACEGALLVVDATQGIQAQTLANVHLALDQGLKIIPVINKIDLPAADPEGVSLDVCSLLNCELEEVLYVSAKTGDGVPALLDAIVDRLPSPTGEAEKPTTALIFDSYYDDYRGVVIYVRVVDGSISKGDHIYLFGSGSDTEVLDVGVLMPGEESLPKLAAGEIGYVVTGFRGVENARVGDTVTHMENKATESLPGYEKIIPMVYAGLYTKEGDDYNRLREALEKLKLNDSSLVFEPESSTALGLGFRAGFLGLLHVDVVVERLKREFDLEIIVTVPSVAYTVKNTKGEELTISSPVEFPDPTQIQEIEEPVMAVSIVTPTDYVGGVMQLVQEKRGVPTKDNMEYLDKERVILRYHMPLSTIVVDFYDLLKNASSGYASVNYEFDGYQEADVRRLDIMVAGEVVEALSTMVYKDEAYRAGRAIVKSLKDLLPRQMFEVRLQAALGAKVIASERIPPMRKDVTAGLYGGDVTRKRKLLEKQKKGKARMKSMGKVDIPQEAFMAVLKRD